MTKADIGLIGLAVMGQNLVLNMNDKGFTVCVFNRTVSTVDHFLNNEAKNTNVIGAKSMEELIMNLKSPKKIILLVKAGQPVDDFIEKLIPLLSYGDIIIDGGNSEYNDSTRRCRQLAEKNILFVGSGVSGGEEGARHGPSLMPGGNFEAWKHIQPIFQAIAAKVGDNEPCCDWVGLEGSGHFVKMVHNGIEYGDMQLICEAYHLMRDLLNMGNDEISATFDEWNKSELESFLIEITSIVTKFQCEDGKYLLNQIYDSAGQKGTGKWTAINALDLGVPVTLIAESVFARCLSALKPIRIEANKRFPSNNTSEFTGNKEEFLKDLKLALYASKIISYTQGFMMMQTASDQYKWNLSLGRIALMWRGGCIIRSRFLQNIKEAYEKDENLSVLIFNEYFQKEILRCQTSWRKVASTAVLEGLPTPAFSSALAFYDGLRTAKLPANLLQAQRDLFGAHQYQLLDNPSIYHHCNWTGTSGSAAASTKPKMMPRDGNILNWVDIPSESKTSSRIDFF